MLLSSFSEALSYALYILIAILVLLLMITIHEFGHYIAGKIFGFGIEEFSIGFGPKIISKKKKNGELFSVRLLPLGGFCAFKGEDKEDSDTNAFNNKKPWQRIIVLISGALMNYIFALLIIGLMFSIYGHTAVMTYEMENPVQAQSEYSFLERDVILRVEGKNVYMLTDVMNTIEGREKGENVIFTILRKGTIKELNYELKGDTKFQNIEDMEKLCTALGVKYQKGVEDNAISTGFRTTGVKLGFFPTIHRTFEYSFKVAGSIFLVLGELLTGSLGLNSVGGTVTTISLTAQVVKTGGLWSLLNIMSFIGVNLAVFNLLPIPALDGSRVVFTIIEWVRKKPINRRVEGIIHTVGLIIIFLFAIIVDLNHCF